MNWWGVHPPPDNSNPDYQPKVYNFCTAVVFNSPNMGDAVQIS